jgi:hypothetical protein
VLLLVKFASRRRWTKTLLNGRKKVKIGAVFVKCVVFKTSCVANFPSAGLTHMIMTSPIQHIVYCYSNVLFSWACLLIKLFTSPQSTCVAWPTSQLVDALLSINPPTFDNDLLRICYPRLIKGPAILWREFLSHNVTAQHLYGSPNDADTCGILKLKLMGTSVAIIQNTRHSCNIDKFLS